MSRAITLYDQSGKEVIKTERRRDVEALQRKRHEAVCASLKRWTTRLKRAKTKVRALDRQRRYYEKVLAEASRKEK